MLTNESLQQKNEIRGSSAPILIKMNDLPRIGVFAGFQSESHANVAAVLLDCRPPVL